MAIFINIIIISMLAVTIAYAWKLNGKLNIIRNHKAELKQHIDAFTASAEKAAKAVDALKRQGEVITVGIDEKISKAHQISDELDLLIAKANRKLTEAKASFVEEKFNVSSIAEAELLRAMREREYRQALAG